MSLNRFNTVGGKKAELIARLEEAADGDEETEEEEAEGGGERVRKAAECGK